MRQGWLEVGSQPEGWRRAWASDTAFPAHLLLPSQPAPPPFPGTGTCPRSLVMSINRNCFWGCCSTRSLGPPSAPSSPWSPPRTPLECLPPSFSAWTWMHPLPPLSSSMAIGLETPEPPCSCPLNIWRLWLASQVQSRLGWLRWSTRIDEESGVCLALKPGCQGTNNTSYLPLWGLRLGRNQNME